MSQVRKSEWATGERAQASSATVSDVWSPVGPMRAIGANGRTPGRRHRQAQVELLNAEVGTMVMAMLALITVIAIVVLLTVRD